jgi:hypothetical protein
VVLADRGYDHDKYRRLVRELQIRPLIARRGTEHGSGLGKQRWVVEQTFALLHAFRRLRIRWEVRADIHEAFLKLACALICECGGLVRLEACGSADDEQVSLRGQGQFTRDSLLSTTRSVAALRLSARSRRAADRRRSERRANVSPEQLVDRV